MYMSNDTPFNVIICCVLYRYDEVCKPGYNFVSGGFSSGTGHFTQVVWKDSVKLGIGQGKATQNGMQCIYVVGRYDIAGSAPTTWRSTAPSARWRWTSSTRAPTRCSSASSPAPTSCSRTSARASSPSSAGTGTGSRP